MKSTININGTIDHPLKCTGKEDAKQYLNNLFDSFGNKVKFYESGVKNHNGKILLLFHVTTSYGYSVTVYFEAINSSGRSGDF
jgi:hypothetical protein